MRLKLVSKTKLPTKFGEFTLVGFEEVVNRNNHIALIYGRISEEQPTLSRIHSECLTGDVFLSLRCDCGVQLKSSLKKIVKEGRGVLLYHRQEGRNIGLLNKIRAYSLQDVGFDTVEANLKLGFKSDERDFRICADMYRLLSIKKIRLITNNPEKVKMMQYFGIEVTERVPIVVGKNSKNYRYLRTKVKKLGHLL
ncbi:GTP cyclohydrolase II [Candidatus Riesia pediculicola]|uniref:GTP cyclohydrolase-2 n=1 Tax=Riesia pediculicola (strain USDA) TaxID=515618 RepID=D4G885_RIEPU|nr:GTP cyclohydrolase II [Candidatus Riesia pediculicola]ADD79615.1 GTP cyclohydrolase II [Candidatus Riesia pediculicola USDA]ARC53783.1 GTP cyclohydrolase [Candidatus Riesia pediculicola]QOJ86420.1 GTP cyclohydrolase II [Candidatus Riesia pediculicola]